jgi:hypothetical protein
MFVCMYVYIGMYNLDSTHRPIIVVPKHWTAGLVFIHI